MEINKQTQSAGENSQLIQAQTVIMQGITEKRAREIYDEKFALTKRDYLTQEAIAEAMNRVNKLEEILIQQMQKVDDGLKYFADPAFQMLLVEAQKTAVSTERKEDYNLLSELLIRRTQSGDDRIERAGLHHAINIVDNISSSALLALTFFYVIQKILPSGNIKSGLKALDKEYGKYIDGDLPLGVEWIEHLDLLRAVRINSFGKFNDIEDVILQICRDFAEVGIKKDSEDFKQAIEILSKCGLSPAGIFVENPCMKEYVRINIASKDEIDNLSLNINIAGHVQAFPLQTSQKDALRTIREMYQRDAKLKQQMKKWLVEEWLAHPNLKILYNWWKQIPVSFDITAAGEVLANANAHRIDSLIPIFKR